MVKAIKLASIVIIVMVVISGVSTAKGKSGQLAFPGAEGYGRFAKGGRGGDVYHVTNLKDSGSGSFREGVETCDGPRTIVFDVSGTIKLKDALEVDGVSGLTIAGQSAPGKGITLRDHGINVENSSNIIMRYFRIRPGNENKKKGESPDAMCAEDNDGMILDHISMSWSIDGMMDTRRMGPFTVQWCIFAEPLNRSLHYKDQAHGYLMSWRDINHNVSIHHNLFSSGTTRHPSIGASSADLNVEGVLSDFRNNINYKIGGGNMKAGAINHNMINNTFLIGPDVSGKGQFIAVQAPQTHAWMSGNVWTTKEADSQANCAKITADNYEAAHYKYADGADRSVYESKSVFPVGEFEPKTETAQQSFESVLKYAGASKERDKVDLRMLKNVRNSTGGIIDSQNDVGGWDEYPSEKRNAGFDTDGDGMPDAWEKKMKLDPNDPDDGNGDQDGDGYTNLEEYLNSLV